MFSWFSTADPAKQPKYHSYPWYCTRFWHGMRFGHWLRLLRRGDYRVHPFRWSLAFTVSLITPFNSVMRYLQQGVYGRKIRETAIEEPPLFVIGHWRSGTTLLHELLVVDDRFAFPTTYQCFAPHHCLVTEWIISRVFGFLVPRQRPMDNMAAGFARPQEDEFALLTLGAPTPYLRMAWPNNPPPYHGLLNMEGVEPADLSAWQEALLGFARMLTFKYQKRLVLKSPPHTGRIGVLAEMFPGARFVHIVRDPCTVFASTRRLWPSLDGVQGLQVPHYVDLEEYVLCCLEQMYDGFEKQKEQLAPGQLCEVRYEDLVRDPLAELERIYQTLELGDFEPVRAKLEDFVEQQRDYQTTPHDLDDELRAKVQQRWSRYFARFGYASESAHT